MPVEIERKFLLHDDRWRDGITRSTHMAQGYLANVAALKQGLAHASVRVRVAGDAAWINVKSAELGIERLEFEYPIPLPDARAMLERLCDGTVEKIRHLVPVAGHTFEIDEFMGDNTGLVVAELELSSADALYPQPPWLGREVSHMPRYFNVNLVAHAYDRWSAAERAGEDA